MADQYGYEKLVYESFPLLAFKEGKDNFELMGFETGEIKDFVPEKVHILISDAMVEHLKITVRDYRLLNRFLLHPFRLVQRKSPYHRLSLTKIPELNI